MTTQTVTIEDIRQAAARLKGHVVDTPCLSFPALAERIGAASLVIKFETMQRTGSFKERGALNKILSIPRETLERTGIVTASAGNHAQGVAYHAQRLHLKAKICMPTTTPTVKIARVRSFGAEIVQIGEVFDEAKTKAEELVKKEGLTMVHPYDDAQVIAGQGTIALEMLEKFPDIDTFAVQVGGGGLASGMFTAAKALVPNVKLFAVQTESFPSLANKYNNTMKLGAGTIADGIAVKSAGDLTSRVLAGLGVTADNVILLKESEVERGILTLIQETRTVCEGAGATGFAALLARKELFKGRHVGVVLSGGNIDPFTLSSLIQRSLARSECLFRFEVDLPDRPMALGSLTNLIGSLGCNIVDIKHERIFNGELYLKKTKVEVEVETEGKEHAERLLAGLKNAHYTPVILSELTK